MRRSPASHVAGVRDLLEMTGVRIRSFGNASIRSSEVDGGPLPDLKLTDRTDRGKNVRLMPPDASACCQSSSLIGRGKGETSRLNLRSGATARVPVMSETLHMGRP